MRLIVRDGSEVDFPDGTRRRVSNESDAITVHDIRNNRALIELSFDPIFGVVDQSYGLFIADLPKLAQPLPAPGPPQPPGVVPVEPNEPPSVEPNDAGPTVVPNVTPRPTPRGPSAPPVAPNRPNPRPSDGIRPDPNALDEPGIDEQQDAPLATALCPATSLAMFSLLAAFAIQRCRVSAGHRVRVAAQGSGSR